ncbi:MAG: two-component system cell cycle response regulator [Planctomycetota bacterium]
MGIRILDLTQREDFALEELAQTIMVDGALSGRVVKMANSAKNQTLVSASSVTEATKRLGASRLRTLALGFTLISDNRSGRCAAFDFEHYWSHALATAVAGHVLATKAGHTDPLEAFTTGLLSGIGRLALACVHPETYSQLLEENPGAEGLELVGLETALYGIAHTEVAAALMEDWGLPQRMTDAVVQHLRKPNDDTDSTLTRTLHASKSIASILIDQGGKSADDWRARFMRINHVAEVLSLAPESMSELCEEVHEAWLEWGRLLDIPTEGGTEVADLVKLWTDSLQANDVDEVELAEDSYSAEASAEVGEERDATRILLIDDDERMLRLLRHHLSREGYEVFTATSSERGLQKALQLTPQLVVTDWMMPGMSGVGLCSTLRKSEAGSRMYILLVTAREDDEQVVEAFQAGADDYIVKPFNPRILLARVRAGHRMIQMRERVEEAERDRLRQVAQLGIMTRRLRAAALTDALTELPNRRYAMDRLRQEWDSSERTGRPLSVVMIDLDHFKRVNDNYGHDAGDIVLRETSRLMRECSRSADVLCRLGGEEFLAINVGCDGEHASVLAERLREAFLEAPISGDSFTIDVTASLGVAQKCPGMSGIDDLLKASDEALYLAKASGRNRVWLSSPDDQAQSA